MPTRLFRNLRSLTLGLAISASALVALPTLADSIQRGDFPALENITIIGVEEGKLIYRTAAGDQKAELSDINAREAWVLGLFALGVLALGVYPKPLTDLMDAPIAQLVSQLAASKL